MAVAPAFMLLLQANHNSGQISWDTLTTTSMTFGGDASLAVGEAKPQGLAVMGGNVFVAESLTYEFGGNVEACALARSGVSRCRVVISISGTRGHPHVAVR